MGPDGRYLVDPGTAKIWIEASPAPGGRKTNIYRYDLVVILRRVHPLS